MSTTTHLHWLAAAIIALLLASAHLLDSPSDIEATQAVAADVQDAIQTAQATPRGNSTTAGAN